MRKLLVLCFAGIALFHFGCYFNWFRKSIIAKELHKNSTSTVSSAAVLLHENGNLTFRKNLFYTGLKENFVTPPLMFIPNDGEEFSDLQDVVGSDSGPNVKAVKHKFKYDYDRKAQVHRNKQVSRRDTVKKLVKSNVEATFEVSPHSLLLLSVLHFNEIFDAFGLSRNCIHRLEQKVHHKFRSSINNLFLKTLLPEGHDTEFTWKSKILLVLRFLSSLRNISDKCPTYAERSPMIRASEAQYLINHLDHDLINYMALRIKQILSLIKALKVEKLNNLISIICEQIIQVSTHELPQCITATDAAMKIISNSTSNRESKLRKKRFLPVIDDITPTGIDRDDSPYMHGTEVFLIDLDDSDKHLKFLYPLKLALSFLTYGLIASLAYAIHFMPLIGPKGPRGEKGFKGWKGYPGWRGQHGDKGEQGDIGVDGFVGQKGWMGLKGWKGSQGHPGDLGPKGVKGSQGKQGKKGHKGKPGDVSDGDIGSKGEDGLPGPTGFDGYEFNIQGKKPKKNKGEKGEHKIITHNHTHDHYHDHSHEHYNDKTAHQLSVRTNSPQPISTEEENTAVLRKSGVFTHHILLDKYEVEDVKSLTSEEISALISSQLSIGANDPTAVEVLNFPQGRLLTILPQSNSTLDDVSDFKVNSNDVRDANSSLNTSNITSSSNEKSGRNSSRFQIANKNKRDNMMRFRSMDDKVAREMGSAHLYGDMASLRRLDDQYDESTSFTESSTESTIFGVTTRKMLYISQSKKRHSLGPNERLESHRKSGTRILEFVDMQKAGVRRRRNIKGEFLQFPAEAHDTARAGAKMFLKSEAEQREQLLRSVNELWRESKLHLGCLHCVLFQCLEERQTISWDSLIIAGFAHVLGDAGSLQLLDQVRRGRDRDVKMRCQKMGRTCYLQNL